MVSSLPSAREVKYTTLLAILKLIRSVRMVAGVRRMRPDTQAAQQSAV